jgi:hypothetical protein
MLMAAACGTVPRPGETPTGASNAALAAWQKFPANQVPRPIVLFGEIYPQGFRFTGGDQKMAAICNKFVLNARLPAELPGGATATWPDGTTAKFQSISAAEAFAAMSKAPEGTASQCATVSPLSITAARFAPAPWRTDRGTSTISSWLFTAMGIEGGELAQPAVQATALWGGARTPYSGNGGATSSVDGRSLTFFFVGAQEGTGPCQANYKGAVAESSSAVAVTVEAIPNPALGISQTPMACTLRGYSRSVKVNLGSPLAGRVVVDSRGQAVSVCPESVISLPAGERARR